MSKNALEERLIRNEVIIREKNMNVSKGLKKYFRRDKDVINAPVAFICECSKLECNENVSTSIKKYEELHKRKDHFIIHKGHGTPLVEKVVDERDNFEIVQKYKLPA